MKTKRVIKTKRVQWAKKGLNCKICDIWIPQGKRRPRQFLCHIEGEGISECQKKHNQKIRGFNGGTGVCDVCGKDFLKHSGQQKRCAGKDGELSKCQIKAKKEYYKGYTPPETKKPPRKEGSGRNQKANEKTKRICLKCGKKFPSNSPFNRICIPCETANTFVTRTEHKNEAHHFHNANG